MPKIVDHDERREHFLAAATDVVVREGFDRLTMREIAVEAGYTHGAIARYFPDKQSLLAAAFLRLNRGINDRIIENVRGLRGLEALEATCRAILPFGETARTARVVIAFWDRIPHDDDLRGVWEEHGVRWRERFAQHLEEAREDGDLATEVDIAVAVNEISTRNMGWLMLSVVLPGAVTTDSLEGGLAALIGAFRARVPQT